MTRYQEASAPVAERGTTVWKVDPTHTHAEFGVRHLMISTVKGHFRDVAGTVTVEDGDVSTAQVDIVIDAASVDTRVAQRDDHLRSPDFFDVARWPNITFRSASVERTGEKSLEVKGDLTIRDVTRPIALDVRETGTLTDPWGNERAGFEAEARINRTDFGLRWNQALETGGVLVGDEVSIHLEVELVRSTE